MTPLVAALASKSIVAKEQAAAALAKLAAGNDDTRVLIAKAGGIEPLVALLDGREAAGSELTQQDAAAALAELAAHSGSNTAIERAGGISPLVALLGSYADVLPSHSEEDAARLVRVTINSKRYAAAALARLSHEEKVSPPDACFEVPTTRFSRP